MKIVLLSILISVVTLLILLWNPRRPVRFAIPSSFLGGRLRSAPRKLYLTVPPWLLWLYVLLATLGCALAYFPWRDVVAGQTGGGYRALWVDNTFSTRVALAAGEVSLSDLAKSVLADGHPVVGIRSRFGSGTEGLTVTYDLVPLDTVSTVESFLEERFFQAGPSAFVRPFDVDALRAVLVAQPEFAAGRARLVIVGDGQRSTLEGLVPLREVFSSTELLAIPPRRDWRAVATEDLLPRELLDLWEQADATDFSDAAFVVVKDPLIPHAARPYLMREQFGEGERAFRQVSSGAEVEEGGRPRGGLFPSLVSVCASEIAGPMELDPYADLRAFASFVGSYVSMVECGDGNSGALLGRDPWRFRQPTLWVVSREEPVLQRLFQQQRLWEPPGFIRGTDALVYVASSRMSLVASGLVTLSPVQLDEGSAPVMLYLGLLPPAEVVDGQGERRRFVPMTGSVDGQTVAFRLADEKIFYLRTTAAMPNGELARSGAWMRFWLEAGEVVSPVGGGIKRVAWADIDAARSWERDSDESIDSLGLWLNPGSLVLEDSDVTMQGPRLGLHVSTATFANILVDIPVGERHIFFYTPAEWRGVWRDLQSERGNSRQNADNAFWFVLGGAVIATLALGLLWVRQGRRAAALLLPIACLVLGLSGFSRTVMAQESGDGSDANLPPQVMRWLNLSMQSSRNNSDASHQRIPFRVGWCAPRIPQPVLDRYEQMRDMLARTGTIRLPETLTPDGCRAGAAEIWWTHDSDLLSARELAQHISGSGVLVLEGLRSQESLPQVVAELARPALGLEWERAPRRGMLYRSFYLLSSFDGCADDKTLLLRVRKKLNAQVPLVIATGARFLSAGEDCFGGAQEKRRRSFVNLMYTILVTDYKEDQLHLPEILGRIRNLGLEP